jgi:hypothetical protein
LEKLSKKGEGGKRIVRGVESGEERERGQVKLDCHVAYAPRNDDRGLRELYGALKDAKRCFDYAQHDIDFVLFMGYGRTRRTRTASERKRAE